MKKKIPGNPPRRRTMLRLLLSSAGAGWALCLPVHPADKKKKPVTDTLIKVTTFTEIGSTLRGAEVQLLPADKDGKTIKGRKLQGQTNGMGEYPFYVPKSEATYVLRAEAKGFEATEKVVKVQGEDQQDVFIQLPQKKD